MKTLFFDMRDLNIEHLHEELLSRFDGDFFGLSTGTSLCVHVSDDFANEDELKDLIEKHDPNLLTLFQAETEAWLIHAGEALDRLKTEKDISLEDVREVLIWLSGIIS